MASIELGRRRAACGYASTVPGSSAVSNPPASSATATVRPGSERLIGAVGTATLFVFAVVTVLYLSFSSGGYYPSAPGFAAVVLVQVLVIRTTLAATPV